MPVYFKHGDHKLDLDDLPLEEYVAIHAATGKQWHHVIARPYDTDTAPLLAAACAKHLGISELPKLTPRVLIDLFSIEAGENIPSEWEGEGLSVPDPKAQEPDPETT